MSEEAVVERLARCEHPFGWGLRDLQPTKLSAMKEKSREVTTPSVRFYLSVGMAYELGESGKWAESRRELEEARLRTDCDDRILSTYRAGFLHVLGAAAAHAALQEGDAEGAKELIDKVKDIDDLSKEDQSAIWALKANIFLEYGIEGSEKALEWANKAVDCEPAEPEWQFCVGKLEGRRRHRGPGLPPPPSEREMRALEAAHAMEPSPTSAVFLAAALVDRAKASGSSRSNDYDRAFSLYNEALDGNKKEDSHVLIRCATGLNKLPPRFAGAEVAGRLFERALAMAPNNAMLNHHLGLLHLRAGELENSMKYLKASEEGGCLPAGLKLLEVLVMKDPEGEGSAASVEEHYKRLEEKYLEEKLQASLHFHAASFHLAVTRDVGRLLYHVTKGLQGDVDLSRFRRFPCKWKSSKNQGLVDVLEETGRTLKEALKAKDTGGAEREEVEALLKRIQERSGGCGTGGERYGRTKPAGRGRGRGGGGWRPRNPNQSSTSGDKKEPSSTWRDKKKKPSSTWRDKKKEPSSTSGDKKEPSSTSGDKKEPSSQNRRSEPRNRACANVGDELPRMLDKLRIGEGPSEGV